MEGSEKPVSEVAKPPQETKKENVLMPLLIWVVIGILLGGVAYVAFFSGAPAPPVPQPQANTTVTPPSNATQIASATATIISEPGCPECNSTELLLAQIISSGPQMKLNITAVTPLSRGSPQADALISQYSIKKLPALVLSKGAADSAAFSSAWANVGGIKATDGSLVFQEPYPPYYDVTTGKTVGLVSLTVIPAPNCLDCFNTSKLVDSLSGSQVRMTFSSRVTLAANSTDGIALIKKYNITRLPAMFLSPDASAYPAVAGGWSQLGTIEPDGWFVYRSTMPPYVDLARNNTQVGLVSIIELTDPNCTACYDVGEHYQSLSASLGMVFTNRTRYNITSPQGMKLLVKYNITEVPTVLLSPQAFAYPAINQSYSQVGTLESDGWLVYRNLSALNVVYKDLTTGKVSGTPSTG